MQCLICGSRCERFYDPAERMEYYRCNDCELVFKEKKAFADFSVQKKRYDLHENDENDAGYRAYFGTFLDFVLPLCGSPRTALDFGCGASLLLSRMMRERGMDTLAFDPIYHADTPYRDDRYDLIVSVEVFEHLHDPKQVFGELLTLLNPGGYLALRTEFRPRKDEDFLKWYYRMDPTHVVFFSPGTLRKLCTDFDCRYLADNGKNIAVVQKCRNCD